LSKHSTTQIIQTPLHDIKLSTTLGISKDIPCHINKWLINVKL